jgi:hypothetical protein
MLEPKFFIYNGFFVFVKKLKGPHCWVVLPFCNAYNLKKQKITETHARN